MAKEHKTFFASAARTATSSVNETISSAAGFFIIDVTSATATPSVVFTIKGVDPVSDSTFTILTSAAITGTGTTVLRVFPGATASANVTVNDLLPEGITVTATHADTDSITYSVSFVGLF